MNFPKSQQNKFSQADDDDDDVELLATVEIVVAFFFGSVDRSSKFIVLNIKI